MATKLARLTLLAVLLLANHAAPSHAVTYSFSGQCTDCFGGTGTATATLVLQDYTPGDPIQSSNLVSFTYDGTDLLAPFVITRDTLSSISGVMPQAPPAFASFGIGLNAPALSRLFSSELTGDWGIDDDGADDFGTNGIWSMAVPEPGSVLLTAVGLIALWICVARTSRRHTEDHP